MQNFFLQVQSSSDESSAITGGLWDIIDKINPLQLPQDAFVTDLAIIMILAGIVTLAFFKIRQPLIIGYPFAGMLIGPLSPLWAPFLSDGGSSDGGAAGLLSDIGACLLYTSPSPRD